VFKKNELNNKFMDMTKVNDGHYVNKSQGIRVETEGMQATIDKFEENRIGQGISNSLPSVINDLIGSNLGPIIGGTQKDATHLQGNGKPAYSNATSSSNETQKADISKLNNDDLIKPYSGDGNKIKITNIDAPNKAIGGNNGPDKVIGQKVNQDLMSLKKN
jgi:hypothetical protein